MLFKKRSRSLLFMMLSALIAPVATLHASDHKDAPLIREDPSADLADLYAFKDPNDAQNLVMIMTVNGFTAPSENTNFKFSPNVEYWFRIDTNQDGRPNYSIRVTMQSQPDGSQVFKSEFPGGIVVKGDVTSPTEAPVPNEPVIATGRNGIRVFAGQRDDPFFFDVVGLGRVLAGTGGFTGRDGFAGYNVSAIAVEVPISSINRGQ